MFRATQANAVPAGLDTMFAIALAREDVMGVGWRILVVALLGVFDGTFAKDGAGRFQSQDAEPDPELRVQWRALESSNVNPIQSTIQLIEVGRAFELAQRSIQQQDELTQKLIQSLHNS
ncbi:MAG: hypothetical protein EDM74_12080 [Armatimonadetes bacterium]|nr:MAG: hypothetical protein EDM74_12080 [Armatimonadota bacterium]